MTRKEAISNVRSFIGQLTEGCQESIRALVPELAESEDERIRKELIQFLWDYPTNLPNGKYSRYDFFTWLEKQKEQKPDCMTCDNPKGCVTCVDGDQWEQKPVEWSKEDERIWNNIWDVLDGPFQLSEAGYKEAAQWFKVHCPYGGQSQVEWSEEDETAYSDLIWCIEQAGKSAKDENDMGNIWFAENWIKNRLKSLRPQPQMLEDWTSEDDELLASVLGCITLVQAHKECGDLKEFKMGYTGEELRSFVRSLKSRPRKRKQPSWKPSEGQMNGIKQITWSSSESSRTI